MLGKYLNNHAEPECQWLPPWLGNPFQHALVVPAYDESPAFLTHLLQYFQNLCIILVINQPKGTPPSALNQQLATTLAQNGHPLWAKGCLQAFTFPAENAVLCVDRYSATQQIPPKQGVGLARKIGFDLALSLYHQGMVRSPWLYSTDADATLPACHFQRPLPPQAAAAVFPFKHQTDATPLGRATAIYEAAITYYAQGLQWAGSPYGYCSLGSALAVNALAYAHARGCPKRAGGEDFYLLNKLAKLGGVYCATGAPVQLQARRSQRVPFGTGPAVNAICQLESLHHYTYYAPEVFHHLKTLLHIRPQLGHTPWPQLQQRLPEASQQALTALGIEDFCQHLHKQKGTPQQHHKAFHDWFDAFVTLKFIRHLQAYHLPAKPLHHCLQAAPFPTARLPP